MFNQLANRLSQGLRNIRGVGRLSQDNIQSTLAEIRIALIEADVALEVVQPFLDRVREKALGQDVVKSVSPGEAFIKVVNDELTILFGESAAEIKLNVEPPVIILMAGLQGSGKTTTAAKLANWLQKEHKKSVLLASADIYRPAAIEQLETLSKQIEAHFFPSDPKQSPVDIANNAVAHAKRYFLDAVIIDTAGRLHVDDALMQEIRDISDAVQPTEILLVVDSMSGQDAARVAKTFNDTLPLTGVILTKMDGDARGGAALSMQMLTQKPIKFIGVGEKIDALERFYPDRMASRILGMGDVVSLVEAAEKKVDQQQAKQLAKKLNKGHRFDFNDFLSQLKEMQKMGGIQSLLGKLPGMGQLPKGAASLVDEKSFVRMQAMVDSMTLKERSFPTLLNGGRKKRIASGSGTTIQDVNKLLKQFEQMQKMISKMKGGKMMNQMRQLQGMMGGKMPGGLGGISGLSDLFK